MINAVLNKLTQGQDIEEGEIREVFEEIVSGVANNTCAISFITALKFDDINEKKLAAAIFACREAVKKINTHKDTENLIEYVSLADYSNFVDIPLACNILCSSLSLGALNYRFSSHLDRNYSYEVLKELKIACDYFDEEKFEKSDFSYNLLSCDENYFKYCYEISSKLPFDNILKVINRFLNPYGVKNQIIGLNNKENIEKYATLCLELNNSNTIVLSSNNLPYFTLDGDTYVSEAWKNKIFSYTLSADLIGFKPSSIDDIKCENALHCADIIEDIFINNKDGAIKDTIIVNSALALYIAKKASSIMDGIKIAKSAIDNGLVKEKLEQLKSTYKMN